MHDDLHLSAQFRAARLALNMTQRQLAYFSGMSIEMIRKLEHGKTNPRVKSLEAVARALQCKLEIQINPNTAPA